MKKILLIATGGTIASKYTENGLSPKISSDELLSYVPDATQFCEIDTIQPFSLDSTNIWCKQWMELASLIEKNYEYYDGFVICHGTDTMAYTAAALSYLIQNNLKPVVITGAQKPIDLPVTDARTNLLDSLRFASHPKAHGVNIVFGGSVIAGTRAKKVRSKSYNAFESVNYPNIAMIKENRIVFYIDDIYRNTNLLKYYHTMKENVFLYKLIPGSKGELLDIIMEKCDAVIIESFGVGGLPNYGDQSFYDAISRYHDAGKMIVMSTQVTHEGSDMSIYQVGKNVKSEFDIPESYDMTLEAVVAKTMWILGQTSNPAEFKQLLYTSINHDTLFAPSENE